MNPPTRYDLTVDPYPELADSPLWARLLPSAYLADGGFQRDGLLGLLHGMRCVGAELRREGGAVRLSAGVIEPAEYARLKREWLQPRAERINALLTELGERMARLEENAAQPATAEEGVA